MEKTKVIIGAGLYGLFAALFCAKQGENIIILEYEDAPFTRATYNNQARVHMGYHYPRSISTAIKTREYFNRFIKQYNFCINDQFNQIYATSSNFSWTNAEQFRKFCLSAQINFEDVSSTRYFKDGMCDGAFLTTEYTYDAKLLKDFFIKELDQLPNVKIIYSANIISIHKQNKEYIITLDDKRKFNTNFILNASYAGINQIHKLVGIEPFRIKYELCEIILCKVDNRMENTGITVMDGPFFSIMPFGKTGYHSLTSVTFTPHLTSFETTPDFSCQKNSNGFCTTNHIGNCNNCPAKPKSAWPYMSSLARKYLLDEYRFEYVDSLYSMKPILKASEIDDSRPTIIRQFSSNPTFVSVLSGKISTVFDLEEVLKNE